MNLGPQYDGSSGEGAVTVRIPQSEAVHTADSGASGLGDQAVRSASVSAELQTMIASLVSYIAELDAQMEDVARKGNQVYADFLFGLIVDGEKVLRALSAVES